MFTKVIGTCWFALFFITIVNQICSNIEIQSEFFDQGICAVYEIDTKEVLVKTMTIKNYTTYEFCWNLPPWCQIYTEDQYYEFTTSSTKVQVERIKLTCCAGYEQPYENAKKCIPKCSLFCESDKCIQMNICLQCMKKYLEPACLPVCSLLCVNGRCVVPNNCLQYTRSNFVIRDFSVCCIGETDVSRNQSACEYISGFSGYKRLNFSEDINVIEELCSINNTKCEDSENLTLQQKNNSTAEQNWEFSDERIQEIKSYETKRVKDPRGNRTVRVFSENQTQFKNRSFVTDEPNKFFIQSLSNITEVDQDSFEQYFRKGNNQQKIKSNQVLSPEEQITDIPNSPSTDRSIKSRTIYGLRQQKVIEEFQEIHQSAQKELDKKISKDVRSSTIVTVNKNKQKARNKIEQTSTIPYQPYQSQKPVLPHLKFSSPVVTNLYPQTYLLTLFLPNYFIQRPQMPIYNGVQHIPEQFQIIPEFNENQ